MKAANKNTQDNLLKRYLQLRENPTLREISQETGIQLSRVFRLLNGSSMKLSEYEIFTRIVEEKMGLENSLIQMARECFEKLSRDSIVEIEFLLKRKLSLWKMKQGSMEQHANLKIV